jgi:hypothetical protein
LGKRGSASLGGSAWAKEALPAWVTLLGQTRPCQPRSCQPGLPRLGKREVVPQPNLRCWGTECCPLLRCLRCEHARPFLQTGLQLTGGGRARTSVPSDGTSTYGGWLVIGRLLFAEHIWGVPERCESQVWHAAVPRLPHHAAGGRRSVDPSLPNHTRFTNSK